MSKPRRESGIPDSSVASFGRTDAASSTDAPGAADPSPRPPRPPGSRLDRWPAGLVVWCLVAAWLLVVGISFTERIIVARERAATLVPGRDRAASEREAAAARLEIRSSAFTHLAFGTAGILLLFLADSWLRRRDRDLARERARLAAIFATSPDLIALKDRDLVYRAANPAFASLVGRPVEAILGRTDRDLFPEAEAARHQAADRQVLADGGTRFVEETLPLQGRARWFHGGRSPVRDAAGRIDGVLWSLRDVTERHETQAALARRDAVLSAAQEAGGRFLRGEPWPDLLPRILEGVGRAVEVSRAYLFENTRDPDGALRTSQRFEWAALGVVSQLSNPLLQNASYREHHLQRWAESLERGEAFCATDTDLPAPERLVLELQGVRTMALIPIHLRGTWWGFIGFDECRAPRTWMAAELDALRVVAQMIGACLERHGFEQELRERERRQRLLVESLPAGVVIHDAAAAILFANAEARRLLGLTESDGFGPDPSPGSARFLHEDGSPFLPHEHPALLVRAGGPPVRHQLVGLALPGQPDPAWVLAHAYPIHDSLGRLQQMIVTYVDVTERRHLEERLQQSQKMDAVGQLAGGIAHDFNNILTATLMQLGQLREVASGIPEARALVRELEQGTQRAANLTRQLLLFSRKSVLNVRPLDLNELVRGLLDMLGRLLGETIALHLHEAPGLPPVDADPGLVGQVILNLVVNARDAMPRGGHLSLSTGLAEFSPEEAASRVDARPGRFAWVAVTDTGTGIAPELMPRIFEPFFTTKEVGKGTGLGLATVHGIVQQHRGWVDVDSALHHGTTFRIFLPVARPVPSPLAAPLEAVPSRGSETVLLVEDEADVRGIVARCLRRQGYQVLEAATAREALATWSGHGAGISLLFTDQVLPEGMTGAELALLLKQERPDLRVILSSGYLPETITPQAADAPDFLHLPKPYDLEALAATVRRCLDTPSSPSPGPDAATSLSA